MNRFALLPIFLLLFLSLKAQDRIISTNHDTIPCRIVSMDDERILYEQKEKNGSVTGKFINLSQVANYTRSSPSKNSAKQQPKKSIRSANVPEHVWNLRLNVGKSTMPWYWDNVQADNSMQEYYNQVKTGYHITTSAIYMVTNHLGFGIDASFIHTRYNGNIFSPYSTSMYATTSELFNQYIHFVGPSVLFQQHIDVKRKFTVSESLSAGAFFLRIEDQNTYPNIDQFGYTDYSINSLITAFNWAAKIGVTTEYRLTHNISIGLGCSFTYGSFTKANLEIREPNNSISLENQEIPNALNMSRIDYSFVVRYQF